MQTTWIRRPVLLAGLPVLLAGCAGPPSPDAAPAPAASAAPAPAQKAAGWGYTGETGPERWGSLSPDFALCETGREQSPIDLRAAAATATTGAPGIDFHYQAAPLGVAHLGSTVQVGYPEGSWIELDGERYDLRQFHFHTPSEHTVGGQSFPAAAHLVHQNAEGELAVVGLLIERGAENEALHPVVEHLPPEMGREQRPAGVMVDASRLLPSDRRAFRYPGSLTTPPCSEGVKWIVMATPIQASDAQIATLQQAIPNTNRPVQPLHGRSVLSDR